MKRHYNIYRIGFSICLFILVISAKNPSNKSLLPLVFTPFNELVNDQKLEVEINGTGGHQGDCIAFSLENKTADTLKVHIPSGHRLTSVDKDIQDILIVKNKQLIILPYAQKTVSGYGFCCQSKNNGPSGESKFNIGYAAPQDWQQLATVIAAHKFPTSAIQSAIWVVSDNHPISSIHHKNLESIQLLRETVADIKGLILPWYTLTYEKDTSLLFSDRPEKLMAQFTYFLNTNAVVTITIRNKYGHLVSTLVKKAYPGRGKHIYNLNLPVKDWPKGNYELCIYEDYNNLNTRKEFTL